MRIIIIQLFIAYIYSQVVCSEDELVRELREDILDNGKLDCLRQSLPCIGDIENEDQRNRRIAASWTGDCSFEAEGQGTNDWLIKLQESYGLAKGLVDVNGNPVEKQFTDQADMCEIVRALIANGKLSQVTDNVNNIPLEITDYIDCPGNEGQTEICAATAYSFAKKSRWYIFLEGNSITFNNLPRWKLSPSMLQNERTNVQTISQLSF